VSQGLVVRTENAQDRRAKTLQLTDKGREVVRTIREHLPERIGCDKLTNAERGDLLTILQKLGA
jgi:DNA-binding MarR family transcriptional regulator